MWRWCERSGGGWWRWRGAASDLAFEYLPIRELEDSPAVLPAVRELARVLVAARKAAHASAVGLASLVRLAGIARVGKGLRRREEEGVGRRGGEGGE